MEEPSFEGTLRWHGQPDGVPFDFENFTRSSTLEFVGGAALEGSAASSFKGDDTRMNPETLMLASLMQCHFLTFMAVASKSRVAIASYSDQAVGRLGMKDGKMRFVEVVLHPKVSVVDPAQTDRLVALHEKAHANCFMGNSVNFEVRVEPIAE